MNVQNKEDMEKEGTNVRVYRLKKTPSTKASVPQNSIDEP